MSQNKDNKNKAKLSDKDLKKIRQEGLNISQKKDKTFNAELKSELKKDKTKSKNIPKWAKILIACAIVGVAAGTPYGIHYYQTNLSQQATGRNLSPEKQYSFVKLVRKYVKSNWRPQEVNRLISKKYNNFSAKNQYQLSYAMYRSQQNSALYYNSFLYFMQAEFSYYNLNSLSNPLKATAKQIHNETIPASLKDIQNNKEFIEYSGTDNFEVLPNFEWLYDNYKTNDDFKSFLEYAKVENEDPIFKDKKVNVKLAYERLGKMLYWVSKHENSNFYGDAMSMAKFYYQAIFQLNTDFGLEKTSKGYTLKPEIYSELKKLASNKKGAFHKDLNEYVKSVGKDKIISPALKTSYETIASSYFGDSVFDNMADAVGGAPKVSQKVPKTVYQSDKGNETDLTDALNDLNKNNASKGKLNSNKSSNSDKKSDKKSGKGDYVRSTDSSSYLDKESKKWNKIPEKEKDKIRAKDEKQRDELEKDFNK